MELAEASEAITAAVGRHAGRIAIVCTDGTRVGVTVHEARTYSPAELIIVVGPYGNNSPDGIRAWGTLHLGEHDVETVEVSRWVGNPSSSISRTRRRCATGS